ncbi:MAG: hypothetical protein WC196_05520 [Bacilli bacterium]|jgi:hypothetical protein
MEATFKITWDDSLGEKWMNVDNLRICLFSDTHIGKDVQPLVKIEEVKEN